MPTEDAASAATSPSTDIVGARAASGAGLTERLAVLDGLAERPLHEHAEVYHGLHADLQAALADIDGA